MGITPACAGNTCPLPLRRSPSRDHPRLRGEYELENLRAKDVEGSPPLARGIQDFTGEMYKKTGITPACAGNTFAHFLFGSRCWDHPRLRGEYLPVSVYPSKVLGSPPLARGILLICLAVQIKKGITPACAGNTRVRESVVFYRRDHPRLRGEYD